MAAITWRNVTAASAGNPSSSLATAASAFGNAAQNSLDLTKSIREGQALETEQRTQDIIGQVMAAGGNNEVLQAALANAGGDINSTQVLDSVLGAQRSNADIALAEQQTELYRQQAEEYRFQNTDEQRAFNNKMKELENDLKQAQIDAQNATTDVRREELDQRRAEGELVQNRINGITAIQKAYSSEGPEGLRGQAIAAIDGSGKMNEARQAYQRSISRYPQNEQQQMLAAWEEQARENFIQAEMTKKLDGWMAGYQSKYGLSAEDLESTTPGQQRARIFEQTLAAEGEEAARQRTLERQRRGRASKAVKDNDLAAVVKTGDGWAIADDADAAARNRLDKGSVHKYVKEDMDIDLDDGELEYVENILTLVKGNKAAFTEVMSKSLADRDRGWVPGDNDDMNWPMAVSEAKQIADEMEGFAYEEANPTSQLANTGNYDIDTYIANANRAATDRRIAEEERAKREKEKEEEQQLAIQKEIERQERLAKQRELMKLERANPNSRTAGYSTK
jgi:hypothetical protein